MSYQAPESSAPTGEIAFKETPYQKHAAIVTYVNMVKDLYFNSTEYSEWVTKTSKVRSLVNQKNVDKTTRFGLVQSILRTRNDNLIDTFSDLFDHPDLIVFTPDDKKDIPFSTAMQTYTNRMLRRIQYQKHLAKRFAYLPEYGWSIASDGYVYNEGMQLVANGAMDYVTGLEDIKFTREMDTALDKPDPKIIPTEHWFGMVTEWGDGQLYQGYLRRWHLKDVMRAYEMKTSEGDPIYNRQELKKLIEAMQSSNVDRDMQFRILDADGGIERDIKWDADKAGSYVDVIVYHGPLNGCYDNDLSKDPQEYDIVCTRNSLLKWCENPQFGYTPITHMRTHPKISSPFSRTFLDLIYPHQQFTDFMTNSAMESIVDTMTRLIAYWPEDLADSEELLSPRGYNAFLEMAGSTAKVPQFIQPQSTPGFGALNSVLEIIDRDKQRAGATDQDLGVIGKTQDKTATAARILASASSKSTRSVVKNMSRDGIVPQIKNLIMLDLVYGDPKYRQIMSNGQTLQINSDTINWWLRDSSAKMNDDITTDKDAAELKFQNFLTTAVSVLPELKDPAHMIEALRMGANMAGLTQAQIDIILPPPIPPELSQQQQAQATPAPAPKEENPTKFSVSIKAEDLKDPTLVSTLERIGMETPETEAGPPAAIVGAAKPQAAPAPTSQPNGGMLSAISQTHPG